MIENKNSYGFAAVVLISAILWFGMLGHRDLLDPDEGRYAGIPAAMVDSGDWVTPRLNGFKYFEKPVLQYWATATFYELLGKSSATARLWTALTGFAMALFAALVAFRLYGRSAALYTYLISISSMMLVAFGHMLTLDMSLTAFIVAGVGSLVIAQISRSSPDTCRNWMLAGWAALALGTLTKGPVAVVLPAGAVLIYSIWQRDLALWKNLHLFKGLILFLLITAPWFVTVSVANPEFAEFFFIHEHLERYTSQVHKREGPLYYFIPYLLVGLCPWLLISLKSLVQPGFKWAPQDPGKFSAERFLWVFVIVTLVFYSLGQSKLPGYILPMIPVIAILSGRRLSQVNEAGADRWVLVALGLTVLLVALKIEGLTTDRFPLHQWQSYAPWIGASGSLFLLAAAALFAKKFKAPLAFAIAAMLSLASFQSLILGFNSLAESRSGRLVAEVIMDSVPAGTTIFSFRTLSESLVFYTGSNNILVEYTGELEMGIKAEPDKYISTYDQFVKKWQDLDQAALILNVTMYEKHGLPNLPGKIVYKGPKRMVFIRS